MSYENQESSVKFIFMQIKTFSCKYGYLSRIRRETEAIHNLEEAYLNRNKQLVFSAWALVRNEIFGLSFLVFLLLAGAFKTLKAMLATISSTATTNKQTSCKQHI